MYLVQFEPQDSDLRMFGIQLHFTRNDLLSKVPTNNISTSADIVNGNILVDKSR